MIENRYGKLIEAAELTDEDIESYIDKSRSLDELLESLAIAGLNEKILRTVGFLSEKGRIRDFIDRLLNLSITLRDRDLMSELALHKEKIPTLSLILYLYRVHVVENKLLSKEEKRHVFIGMCNCLPRYDDGGKVYPPALDSAIESGNTEVFDLVLSSVPDEDFKKDLMLSYRAGGMLNMLVLEKVISMLVNNYVYSLSLDNAKIIINILRNHYPGPAKNFLLVENNIIYYIVRYLARDQVSTAIELIKWLVAEYELNTEDLFIAIKAQCGELKKTSLYYACDNDEILKFILSLCPVGRVHEVFFTLDSTGESVLYYCASRGLLGAINTISRYCPVNSYLELLAIASTYKNYTPLHIAILNSEVVAALLNNLISTQNSASMSIINSAGAGAGAGLSISQESIVKLLGMEDSEGIDVIHLAVSFAATDTLSRLLSICSLKSTVALLNREDSMHNTPLHLAVTSKHIDTIRLIFEIVSEKVREDVDSLSIIETEKTIIIDLICKLSSRGINALHLAINTNNKTIVQELLKVYPAEELANLLSTTDINGRTPLHLAIISQNVEILEELLNACPTECIKNLFMIKDVEGKTVFDISENPGYKHILESFLVTKPSVSSVYTPSHSESPVSPDCPEKEELQDKRSISVIKK